MRKKLSEVEGEDGEPGQGADPLECKGEKLLLDAKRQSRFKPLGFVTL